MTSPMRGVTALGAAEHLDAHQFLGAAVVRRGQRGSASGSCASALPLTRAARVTISPRASSWSWTSDAHSAMRTTSPSLHSLFSSCACSLVERRMILPYSGCCTWRSTQHGDRLVHLVADHAPFDRALASSVFRSWSCRPYFFAPSRVLTLRDLAAHAAELVRLGELARSLSACAG